MLQGFDIIQYFEQHPSESITILQLAKRTGRSYGATHAAATALCKQGVLRSERAGAAMLCSVNLRDPVALALLTASSLLRTASLPPEKQETIRSLIAHLRDSVHTAWLVDDTIHIVVHGHSHPTVVMGTQVKIVSIRDLYPTVTQRGHVIWGADTFWRMAGELQ